MPIFNRSAKLKPAPNQLDHLVQSLNTYTNTSPVINANVAGAALSLEALRDDELKLLSHTVDDLRIAIETISADLNLAPNLNQIDAGIAAGIQSGDIRRFFTYKPEMTISTESGHFVNIPMEDGYSTRPFSLEAYDERENRQAAVFSIAYNMQAARQDEFGETFFPTIVVTADNVGLSITIRLMQVFDGLQRQISGAVDNYNKKNIIRAIADPTILKNDLTRIVPVHRTESAANFVDTAVIPTHVYNLEGESITTAPLATGKEFSLLGISQTASLLANGVLDITDAIEPAVNLTNIYVSVVGTTTTDVLSFNVANLPLSNFVYSIQGNYRLMSLNFETTSLLMNDLTKQIDGSAPTVLTAVGTNHWIVRLRAKLSGSVNLELATTSVFGNLFEVSSIQDSVTGNLVDITSGAGKTFADLVKTGTIIGYDLQAYRTNTNRRQRGQLIDTTYYTQHYNVMFRSPITALHPMMSDGQTDTSDLQALVTATRIRTSNAAVTTLVATADQLSLYVDSKDVTGVGPDVLGIGRFFVKPIYAEEALDMNVIVDSLRSIDRPGDIQAALVNKIRDHAYRMYRDSEYKAAADAVAGGVAPVPTVIIGTDPVIARYLNVTGDLRTLGGEFDVRIVSTLDRRVAGKIFITFGVFDDTRNVSPNPLSFGNMAWSPELTVVLPISRDGQISKELSVSPRFIHVVNLPILVVLTVANVPDVLNKVPLHNHVVV